MLGHAKLLRPTHALPARLIFYRGYAQDFRIKRIMRLPKQVMYDVVGDVSKYSEFVPYCLESTVMRPTPGDKPATAMLRVGWNQLDERFESQLKYTDDQVLASAADNKMFEELLCEWTVKELAANQCQVELKLRFKFQNKLYDFMAQNAGTLVAKKMIDAFTKRAIMKKSSM